MAQGCRALLDTPKYARWARALIAACHGAAEVGYFWSVAQRTHDGVFGDPDNTDHNQLVERITADVRKEVVNGRHLVRLGCADPTRIDPPVRRGLNYSFDPEHNKAEDARFAYLQTPAGREWYESERKAFVELPQHARQGLDFEQHAGREFRRTRPDERDKQAKAETEAAERDKQAKQQDSVERQIRALRVKRTLREAGIDPASYAQFARKHATEIPAEATAEQIVAFAAAKESV